MPITIKQNSLKFKDSRTGQYKIIDAITNDGNNGSLIVNLVLTNSSNYPYQRRTDKTAGEIITALQNGRSITIIDNNNIYSSIKIQNSNFENNNNAFLYLNNETSYFFLARSPSDYFIEDMG